METTKGMKNNQCHMVLLLPQAEAIRDEMGKRLIIAVFKTDNPTPFVAGQDPMQKTTKQHIAYSLYQNNELQLHINSKETIIIHIHDFLHLAERKDALWAIMFQRRSTASITLYSGKKL